MAVTSWRKRVFTLLRLLLSGLLLWLVFRSIDWSALMQARNQLQVGWLPLAWAGMVLASLLAVVRWGWIARSGGLQISWKRLVGLYFAGGLINQGVPSTLGGDTYRAVLSAHGQTIHGAPALRYGILYVALDRGMGFLTNLLVGASGLILAGVLLVPWAPRIGWLLIIVVGAGTAVATLLLFVQAHNRHVHGWVTTALQKIRLPWALPALQTTLGFPQVLAQLLLGVAIHLCNLMNFAICLMAFGVEVPLAAVMVGIPTLSLLMMLPVSISGWGVREATLSSVLVIWHVPSATTVLASICFGLLTMLCYLPAIWFLLRNRVRPAPVTEDISQQEP